MSHVALLRHDAVGSCEWLGSWRGYEYSVNLQRVPSIIFFEVDSACPIVGGIALG